MIPQIRSGVLTNFIPTVEELGGDVDAVLREAGAEAETLSRPDNYISYQLYLKLLDTAAAQLNCPHFGLEMSHYLGAQNLGVTGFLLIQGGNIGEAWHAFARFYHVHDTWGTVRVTEQGDTAFVRYEVPRHDIPGTRQALDTAAGITANVHKAMMGECYQAECVLFPYPEPEDLAPYQRLDARKLVFDQAGYATGIPLALLDQPIEQSDPRMKALLEQYLASLELSSEHACSRQVEELIHGVLPTGRCTIENVARFMSMSVRTLQNRLEAEHTSFKLLLEQTRRKLALHHLSRGDVQLTQLAYLLGYSELSAFSRSFRRWYGCSPREWQRQARRVTVA